MQWIHNQAVAKTASGAVCSGLSPRASPWMRRQPGMAQLAPSALPLPDTFLSPALLQAFASGLGLAGA